MTTLEFPSPQAAWGFAQQAREMGHRTELQGRANLFAPGTHAAPWGGALVGGALLGLLGAFAEHFAVGLPRLGPIFAAPVGAPTVLFSFLGGSLGALLGGLATLRKDDPAHQRHQEAVRQMGQGRMQQGQTQQSGQMQGGMKVQPARVRAEGERDMLEHMAMTWGGHIVEEEQGTPQDDKKRHTDQKKPEKSAARPRAGSRP